MDDDTNSQDHSAGPSRVPAINKLLDICQDMDQLRDPSGILPLFDFAEQPVIDRERIKFVKKLLQQPLRPPEQAAIRLENELARQADMLQGENVQKTPERQPQDSSQSDNGLGSESATKPSVSSAQHEEVKFDKKPRNEKQPSLYEIEDRYPYFDEMKEWMNSKGFDAHEVYNMSSLFDALKNRCLANNQYHTHAIEVQDTLQATVAHFTVSGQILVNLPRGQSPAKLLGQPPSRSVSAPSWDYIRPPPRAEPNQQRPVVPNLQQTQQLQVMKKFQPVRQRQTRNQQVSKSKPQEQQSIRGDLSLWPLFVPNPIYVQDPQKPKIGGKQQTGPIEEKVNKQAGNKRKRKNLVQNPVNPIQPPLSGVNTMIEIDLENAGRESQIIDLASSDVEVLESPAAGFKGIKFGAQGVGMIDQSAGKNNAHVVQVDDDQKTVASGVGSGSRSRSENGKQSVAVAVAVAADAAVGEVSASGKQTLSYQVQPEPQDYPKTNLNSISAEDIFSYASYGCPHKANSDTRELRVDGLFECREKNCFLLQVVSKLAGDSIKQANSDCANDGNSSSDSDSASDSDSNGDTDERPRRSSRSSRPSRPSHFGNVRSNDKHDEKTVLVMKELRERTQLYRQRTLQTIVGSFFRENYAGRAHGIGVPLTNLGFNSSKERVSCLVQKVSPSQNRETAYVVQQPDSLKYCSCAELDFFCEVCSPKMQTTVTLKHFSDVDVGGNDDSKLLQDPDLSRVLYLVRNMAQNFCPSCDDDVQHVVPLKGPFEFGMVIHDARDKHFRTAPRQVSTLAWFKPHWAKNSDQWHLRPQREINQMVERQCKPLITRFHEQANQQTDKCEPARNLTLLINLLMFRDLKLSLLCGHQSEGVIKNILVQHVLAQYNSAKAHPDPVQQIIAYLMVCEQSKLLISLNFFESCPTGSLLTISRQERQRAYQKQFGTYQGLQSLVGLHMTRRGTVSLEAMGRKRRNQFLAHHPNSQNFLTSFLNFLDTIDKLLSDSVNGSGSRQPGIYGLEIGPFERPAEVWWQGLVVDQSQFDPWRELSLLLHHKDNFSVNMEKITFAVNYLRLVGTPRPEVCHVPPCLSIIGMKTVAKLCAQHLPYTNPAQFVPGQDLKTWREFVTSMLGHESFDSSELSELQHLLSQHLGEIRSPRQALDYRLGLFLLQCKYFHDDQYLRTLANIDPNDFATMEVRVFEMQAQPASSRLQAIEAETIRTYMSDRSCLHSTFASSFWRMPSALEYLKLIKSSPSSEDALKNHSLSHTFALCDKLIPANYEDPYVKSEMYHRHHAATKQEQKLQTTVTVINADVNYSYISSNGSSFAYNELGPSFLTQLDDYHFAKKGPSARVAKHQRTHALGLFEISEAKDGKLVTDSSEEVEEDDETKSTPDKTGQPSPVPVWDQAVNQAIDDYASEQDQEHQEHQEEQKTAEDNQ